MSASAANRHRRPTRLLRFDSMLQIFEYPTDQAIDTGPSTQPQKLKSTRPARSNASPPVPPLLYRLAAVLVILAVLVPLLNLTSWFSRSGTGTPLFGADAGPVMIKRQAASPVDVCTRWAHMSAVVNGTLYLYGGQATTRESQTTDTWNNNFLTLDLTKSWQIASAPLAGLPQPSGPPKVALGSLWQSHDSLFLYGGEYSSAPPAQPEPYSLWQYNILDKSWKEHASPKTSAGTYSGAADVAVGRAAEGAGISVPALGRAWYFGGHQDGYTTPGWSQSIWRIYLTSLLEFTFPGRSNEQVDTLKDGTPAGSDGAWRNMTEGGVESAGFAERADGLLLHVPGYGAEGLLLGMAGGTNTSFQQMSQIDVYDIATSKWYKQAAAGTPPRMRVNPCAVVASAPDGSSQNIYMFGGQNLQPANNQTRFDDMWILTLPSFTWIRVDAANQAVPLPRAGHTCNIWNGQMVMVGGYVGPDVSCDSPGVYVYDLSTLAWKQSYTSLADSDANADPQKNPLNQQLNQRIATSGSSTNNAQAGLEGIYGYTVPKAVQDVIGGGPQGGATVTQPAQVPTDGPMKTGRPVTYTVTANDGSVSTESADSSSSSNNNANSNGSGGPNTAAIVAGAIAGVLGVAALYLAYCVWLYRKRMREYKRHVAMATRMSYDSWGDTPLFGPAAAVRAAGGSGEKNRHDSSGTGSLLGAGAGGSGHSKDADESSAFIAGGSGGGGGKPAPAPGRSTDDLLNGGEPTLWGTLIRPRRSLRIVNMD